jgi:hypothetical protein
MIKVKILKDSLNRKPIDRSFPDHTQSKISGFGLSNDQNVIGPAGDANRAGDERYDKVGMEEECGCGCEACSPGGHDKGNPDLDGDGTYNADELQYHFDLNNDGAVTPEEYKDHVQWHEEHPEVFEIDDEYLTEKKDRCYRLAKQKYDVFPSAYSSGFIVRCRKGKVAKKKNEEQELDEGTFDKEKSQGLHGWFSRQGGKGKSKGWVDCSTCRKNPETGRKQCKTCGRQAGEKRSKYPACRPTPSACTKTGTSKKKSSSRVSWKSKKEE